MHPFETQLSHAWPLDACRGQRVMLAVSGGADSVALLRSLAVLAADFEFALAVAHFDHGLRGDDSAADSQFVMELCRQLNLKWFLGTRDKQSTPSEEALRAQRYHFLQSTAEEYGARYLATAHTADDQVETILHRILRGTSIAGLVGIPRVRTLGPAVTLVRPLLAHTRQQVVAYLTNIGQPWREDSTNRDSTFTRNRIRNELLPLLKANYNANVAEALRRLGVLAAEVQEVVEPLAQVLLERAVVSKGPTTVIVDLNTLAGQPRHLVREMFVCLWRVREWPLQAMGAVEWDRLADLALGPGAARGALPSDFPGGVRAQLQDRSLKLDHPADFVT